MSFLVSWSQIVRSWKSGKCGGSWVVGFSIIDRLTKNMSRPFIACFTFYMFFKCNYDYSMPVSKYQIYYSYVLELSLIWTNHPNTCISWQFIELFVHSLISIFFFFKWGANRFSWGLAKTRTNPQEQASRPITLWHYLLILSLWVLVPFSFLSNCCFWVVFNLKVYTTITPFMFLFLSWLEFSLFYQHNSLSLYISVIFVPLFEPMVLLLVFNL